MKNTSIQEKVESLVCLFDENDVVSSYQYPDTLQVLISLFSENDIDFCEKDFIVSGLEQGIDEDGFPFFKQTIIIKPVSIVLDIIAYHHSDWDFYIDEVIKLTS